VPDRGCCVILVLKIDLDAAGARIACSADQHIVDTGKASFFERIIFQVENIDVREGLHDLCCIGSLDGQQAGPVGDVVHLGLLGVVFGYPSPILFNVGGVDHQHINFVGFQAIDDEVVNAAA